MNNAPKVLLIACGALANEIIALCRINQWEHFEVQCLPAHFHNRPELIAPALAEKLVQNRGLFSKVLVAYADCGTGGDLDRVIAAEGGCIERLPGAHCYEFFAGSNAFAAIEQEEFGTFYLTDFLLRHFDRFVIEGLGIDKHPELMEMYFGNYKRLLYLAQVPTPDRLIEAQAAADKLGLRFEYKETGYGDLEIGMKQITERVVQWQK